MTPATALTPAQAGSSRLSRVWTFRWRVEANGVPYDVRLESGWTTNVFVVARNGVDIAREALNFYSEPFRLQALEVATESGALRLETAPRNWYAYGLKASLVGEEIFRSHPEPFAGLASISAVSNFGRTGKSQETLDRLNARRAAMWPSFWTDIAMAFLMYIVASRYSLRDAALIGAAAGLVLYAVQFVLDRTLAKKIDLTGGLAGFGILMLLLSAGFAWIVQNELIIQLKGSLIGLICAALFALDAALGGRYLGERMVRYITFIDLDPKRFVMASAIASLALALINVAIALGLSREAWIFYRYWLQPVLGAGLTFWSFRFARRSDALPA